MSREDDVRTRLREKLVELVGMDETDMLMDRPLGGWGDVATNTSLAPRFAAIDQKFAEVDDRFRQIDWRFEHVDRRLDRLEEKFDGFRSEMQQQTWRLITAMFAAMGVLSASIIAAVRL